MRGPTLDQALPQLLRRWRPQRACLALLLGLMGCQPNPETAHIAAQPQTAPVRTITSFNDALRCMDELFLAQGKKDIYITSAGIPDATGLVAAGTKEMLITAIAKMSATSGAFRFVDYDPTQLDVQVLSELVGLRDNFVAPNYYIRGAITQLDSNVLSSSANAGISTPYLDLAVSRDQVVSVMSLDLNIGKLVTRQIIAGMSASNSIAVVRSGKGGDVGGVIGKAGLSLSVSLDRSEGFHQAVRNLVELSTIEALGKLTRVPYWQCLQIDQTNPTYRTEAREWFDTMSTAERVRFVRTNLAGTGYVQGGGSSDQVDPELSTAIARYQAEHDLIPSGRIDFDLYAGLLSAASRDKRQFAAVAPLPAGAVPTAGAPATSSGPATGPLSASVAAAASPPPAPTVEIKTSRGGHPSFRVNDTLVVEARTTQDGFLYCYYQDSEGAVARIFPNRFQPNAFVRGGSDVEIPPGAPKPFDIRFDKRNAHEAVACVASPLEIGLKLPEQFKVQDLEPLPVHNLKDVIESFRRAGSGQISEGWLPIEVM
jgi:curli biogenesis system outer membrane secretion channel CsgG